MDIKFNVCDNIITTLTFSRHMTLSQILVTDGNNFETFCSVFNYEFDL